MRHQSQYGTVGMAVEVHGQEIREYPHSDGQTYVWARHGNEYSIVLWNFTNRRVEVVVTVDGLDIIAGRVGDYHVRRGYVIDAHTKPRAIPGFRLSDQAVARFTFGAPGNSYAALTDRPANIGVIGAAFFMERVPLRVYPSFFASPRPHYKGVASTRENFSFNDAAAATRGPSLGTEFGREVDFQTGQTSFMRVSGEPLAILALRYETKEQLRAMGIQVDRPLPAIATPNPFPGSGVGCPPPPNWRR